jgi:hypothetical protein
MHDPPDTNILEPSRAREKKGKDIAHPRTRDVHMHFQPCRPCVVPRCRRTHPPAADAPGRRHGSRTPRRRRGRPYVDGQASTNHPVQSTLPSARSSRSAYRTRLVLTHHGSRLSHSLPQTRAPVRVDGCTSRSSRPHQRWVLHAHTHEGKSALVVLRTNYFHRRPADCPSAPSPSVSMPATRALLRVDAYAPVRERVSGNQSRAISVSHGSTRCPTRATAAFVKGEVAGARARSASEVGVGRCK